MKIPIETGERKPATNPGDETPESDMNTEGTPQAADDASVKATEAELESDSEVDDEPESESEPEAEPESEPEPEPEPEIDWQDRCLRAMAELENVQKTVPKRIDQGIFWFKKDLFGRLLDLADGFERALAQGGDEDNSWRQGVESLQRILLEVFEKSGLTTVSGEGEPFDPTRHEVVAAVPQPEVEDGRIIAVQRRGWMLGEQLLRPAQVVVAKNANE